MEAVAVSCYLVTKEQLLLLGQALWAHLHLGSTFPIFQKVCKILNKKLKWKVSCLKCLKSSNSSQHCNKQPFQPSILLFGITRLRLSWEPSIYVYEHMNVPVFSERLPTPYQQPRELCCKNTYIFNKYTWNFTLRVILVLCFISY